MPDLLNAPGPGLNDVMKALRPLLGLRASPRLLLGVCGLQAFILVIGAFMQLGRSECTITLPSSGPIMVDCDSCRVRGLGWRQLMIFMVGGGVIACGVLAVIRRDQNLVFIYGSAMIVFAFAVGLTAILTSLETPVLEVAVDGVTDPECMQMAYSMMFGAKDHATFAGLGCIVDSAGALLAIRSKELFQYEEISAQHAQVRGSQKL